MPTAEWRLAGRYRVLERIGSGGMAEVFRAHDELLGRDVAVKVFRSIVDPGSEQEGRARQELELQALAQLNHPNLITLFDASLSGGAGPGFLVMELVEGPSLGARLAAGPLPEPELRELGAQIADALAYVHAQGMVHRDVKPANILLGSEITGGTRARLSDFGIVRMLGSERMTNVELTLGTACYLAPEQARGADVGPEADSYALGLVLLEALTGVRAYDGSPVEAAIARLSRPPDIPPDLPEPWPALLAAMTASEPEARPPADAVASALRAGRPTEHTQPVVLAAAPAAAPPAESAGSAGSAVLAAAEAGPTGTRDTAELLLPSHRRRVAVLVGLVALLALLGATAYVLAGPAADPRTDQPAGVETSAPVHHSSTHRAQPNAPAPATAANSATASPATSAPPTRRSSVASSAPTSRAPASSNPVPPTTPNESPTPTPTPTVSATPTPSESPTPTAGSGGSSTTAAA